jgi:hypothetical protein
MRILLWGNKPPRLPTFQPRTENKQLITEIFPAFFDAREPLSCQLPVPGSRLLHELGWTSGQAFDAFGNRWVGGEQATEVDSQQWLDDK